MDSQTRDTYRYVRLLTPVPAAWLLIAIVAVAVVRHEVLDSISDYYGGPLRDVFVGALMASGIGMIAYKGRSKLEDYALNFAGVNAFFVALVSNSFQSLLNATARSTPEAGAVLITSSEELLQNLRIAVGTLLVVLTVFVIFDMRLMNWARLNFRSQTSIAKVLIVISVITELALLAIVLLMLGGLKALGQFSIFSSIHFTAATLLIMNLSFAAASHAFPGKLRRSDLDEPGAKSKVQKVYRWITGLMWLGLVGAIAALVVGIPYTVITVELWEIVLFLIFWIVAIKDEWNRAVPIVPAVQQLGRGEVALDSGRRQS